jgi:hypothetical protein
MDVRPTNHDHQAPARPVATAPKKQKRTFPNGHWILPFAAGIIISLAVIMGALAIQHKQGGSASEDIDTTKYQAVFMTNGQVYFGKLSDPTRSYAKLTDVYYLQVQQSVQPATDENESSQVSLTKLGSELHGPTDKMHISRDQILFWENLKDDSTVVKAIKEYKS